MAAPTIHTPTSTIPLTTSLSPEATTAPFSSSSSSSIIPRSLSTFSSPLPPYADFLSIHLDKETMCARCTLVQERSFYCKVCASPLVGTQSSSTCGSRRKWKEEDVIVVEEEEEKEEEDEKVVVNKEEVHLYSMQDNKRGERFECYPRENEELKEEEVGTKHERSITGPRPQLHRVWKRRNTEETRTQWDAMVANSVHLEERHRFAQSALKERRDLVAQESSQDSPPPPPPHPSSTVDHEVVAASSPFWKDTGTFVVDRFTVLCTHLHVPELVMMALSYLDDHHHFVMQGLYAVPSGLDEPLMSIADWMEEGHSLDLHLKVVSPNGVYDIHLPFRQDIVWTDFYKALLTASTSGDLPPEACPLPLPPLEEARLWLYLDTCVRPIGPLEYLVPLWEDAPIPSIV